MSKNFILTFCFLFLAIILTAQSIDWNNSGGNSRKNGYVDIAGPTTDSILWQTASNGIFGTPVFIEGNYLVTMRFQSQTYAPVECYDLNNGNLLWSIDVTNSTGRSLPVGLRDNRVYVVRYTESLSDTLYALNIADGSRIWTANVTVAPYITETGVFDAAGNFYISGQGYLRTYKINPQNGQMIWQVNTVPMSSGSGEMVINNDNNTGYTLEQNGGISYLWATDLSNGTKKYSRVVNALQAGGNVPQSAIMLGNDDVVYVQLTEDNVAALKDDGSQLSLLWQTRIGGNASFSLMCVGPDGSVYAPTDGKIVRLDPLNGDTINLSQSVTQGGFFSPRLTAVNNNMIYMTNGENYIYAFDYDLNLLWSNYFPNTNTSGISISANGLAAVAGQNGIRVYTPTSLINGIDTDIASLLSIYPNPSSSRVYIKADYSLSGKIYSLIDLNGRTLKTGTVAENTELDLIEFSSGLYYLKIEGISQVFKVIKM
jgi:outer membrane protein assembly factor BamB